MINTKTTYLALAITTIILGLVIRKIPFIPAITGDMLYAVMAYWLCRFLFFKRSKSFSLFLAVTFCFFIECLQLIQTPFFIYIRSHSLLRLVFGQGFLWSDLLAYMFGASIVYLCDKACFTARSYKEHE